MLLSPPPSGEEDGTTPHGLAGNGPAIPPARKTLTPTRSASEGRTSIEGIINFYKANYPRPPYREQTYPPVKCPVLMIHGLDDMWLMPEALNDTWRYVDNDLTLVTVPNAGHWVHHDAAAQVTRRMVGWLTRA